MSDKHFLPRTLFQELENCEEDEQNELLKKASDEQSSPSSLSAVNGSNIFECLHCESPDSPEPSSRSESGNQFSEEEENHPAPHPNVGEQTSPRELVDSLPTGTRRFLPYASSRFVFPRSNPSFQNESNVERDQLKVAKATNAALQRCIITCQSINAMRMGKIMDRIDDLSSQKSLLNERVEELTLSASCKALELERARKQMQDALEYFTKLDKYVKGLQAVTESTTTELINVSRELETFTNLKLEHETDQRELQTMISDVAEDYSGNGKVEQPSLLLPRVPPGFCNPLEPHLDSPGGHSRQIVWAPLYARRPSAALVVPLTCTEDLVPEAKPADNIAVSWQSSGKIAESGAPQKNCLARGLQRLSDTPSDRDVAMTGQHACRTTKIPWTEIGTSAGVSDTDTVEESNRLKVQDFLSLRTALRQTLEKEGFQGNSIGEMINAASAKQMTPKLRSKLHTVNDVLNTVVSGKRPFTNYASFVHNLAVLCMKWPGLERACGVFKQHRIAQHEAAARKEVNNMWCEWKTE